MYFYWIILSLCCLINTWICYQNSAALKFFATFFKVTKRLISLVLVNLNNPFIYLVHRTAKIELKIRPFLSHFDTVSPLFNRMRKNFFVIFLMYNRCLHGTKSSKLNLKLFPAIGFVNNTAYAD